MKTEPRKTIAANVAAAIYRALEADFCRHLRDVPGLEGVILYNPEDIALDRPLRWYRRLCSKRLGRTIIYEIPVSIVDAKYCDAKRSSKVQPMFRRRFKLFYKGKTHDYRCSQLTMRVLTGFAVADPRHWVVDHINGDPMDDRPSNLQVISQSDNCRRSERHRRAASENIKNYHNRKHHVLQQP